MMSFVFIEFYKAVDTAAAIIRINQPYLVENIQSNRLIKQLRSTDCLTDLQTRLVSRKNLDSDKTKLLPGNNNSDVWHIIRSVDNKRRSTFIGCLNRTSHRRIVEVIENGGGCFILLPINRIIVGLPSSIFV